MSFSKLKKIHVIIIGSFVWILAGVLLFFLFIKPASENLAKETSRYDTAYPDSTPDKAAAAERNLQEAKLQVAKIQTQFDAMIDKKMPNLRFDNREKGMLQLWHEQVEVLGPLIEKFVRKSGVTILSNIQIPAPTVNPNDPIFSLEYFPVHIGTIQVRGNFKEILQHIEKWNTFNRLVQVDLPSLEGSSPGLTSAYNLTVYIFPRTTAKNTPTIDIAGQPTTGAGGGNVQVGVAAPGAPMMGAPMGAPMQGPMPMGGPMPGPGPMPMGGSPAPPAGMP